MEQDVSATAGFFAERAPAWFEAAQQRRSRRRYTGQVADGSTLDALERACTTFRPLPGARVELVRDPAVDVFLGTIGSYGKVSGAPHLMVVLADAGSEAQVAAGYTGEACILEATALGLGTCWIGGFFDADRVASLVQLGPDERAVAVSPVGEPLASYSSAERLMSAAVRSRNRKALEIIAPGVENGWPHWARSAVECARNAPSAVNRQPWRFALGDGELSLSKDTDQDRGGVTRELDCGIAMLHAEVGARQSGVLGSWRIEPAGLQIARFTPA